MKKRCLLSLFLSAVLVLGTSVPAFAQTLTLDTDGTDGYSGDYLMTLNTRMNFKDETDFDNSWEATGVPGAQGISGTAATATAQSTEENAVLADSALDAQLNNLEGDVSLTTQDAVTYTPDDTKQIHSILCKNYPVNAFQIKCVTVTKHCTFWIYDESDALSNDTVAKIKAMAPALEEHAQIMEKTFGDSSRIDVDGDQRVAFIFYPFADAFSGADGTFSAYNLYKYNPDAGAIGQLGNSMDMVNVNSDNMGTGVSNDALIATLCHEWQHLINCSQTMGTSIGSDGKTIFRSDGWLNETFSQSAMGVNGLAATGISGQAESHNDYLKQYDHELTMPFVLKFNGNALPTNPGLLRVAIYTQWYLFGRYLAAQTEGCTGGGDEIYKTVFNAIRDANAKDATSGVTYQNIGYCTTESLTKALTDMGYMGDGSGAKVKNLDEMLRNFVIAATFRQTDGVYALADKDNFDLSTVDTAKINTAAETPVNLPGGYSAAFTKIDGGSMTVDTAASGADIEHVGIKVNYDGVQADGYSPVSGAMNVNKGTQVTLSTTDTNTTIRYTTDGTDPTATSGKVYDGTPITINGNTIIKAVDTDQWGTTSVNTFYYTIGRSASATTVTINGVKGQPITPQDLTIFLTGDQFKNLSVGDDVTSLFPNLTPGLKATVTRLYNRTDAVAQFFNPTVQAAETAETYDTMDVTISGTPTVTGEVDLTLSIPAQYLSSGIAFTDVPLGTAKIDVTETAADTNAATGIQSDSTPMFIAMGLIAAAAALIIIAVPRKRKQ